MAKKQKYYVVWEGFTPGIYMTWDECKIQIGGHPSAKYKAFDNRAEAEFAQKRNYFEFVNKAALPKKESGIKQSRSAIIADSISVDAACTVSYTHLQDCIKVFFKFFQINMSVSINKHYFCGFSCLEN